MKLLKKIGEKMRIPKGKLSLGKAGKRNLLLAASLIIISLAVFLNWRFNEGDNSIDGIVAANADQTETEGSNDTSKVLGESVEVGSSVKGQDYFAVSVIDRERVRDEAIETYRNVAESETATQDEKNNALAKMSSLAACMTKEVNIENLIMAKGFEDCVAVVTDAGASVVVKTVGLLPSEVAQIKEIVMEQTSLPVENVKIIEHE